MMRILGVFLILFVSGCATVPRTTGVAAPAATLEGLCGKHALGCSWDAVAQTVTMHYQGQKVQVLIGSRVALIGSDKVILSAPLTRLRGSVVVPPDLEKLVLAIGKPSAVPLSSERSFRKIVVDAGHGGKDPGAIGFRGVREKDIILDIALRVARNFRAMGVEVILTRGHDEFVSLAQRTSLASQPGVDLFISIHANASRSRQASGVEIYYVGPLGLEDKLDDQRLHNEKRLCGALNMRRDSAPLRGIVTDMLYTHKLADAPRVADAIARGLDRDLGQVSRGSKRARFFVLRNTLVPAVLVEVGFISNVKEAERLKNGAYRQKIADAMTKSVMRYVYAPGI